MDHIVISSSYQCFITHCVPLQSIRHNYTNLCLYIYQNYIIIMNSRHFFFPSGKDCFKYFFMIIFTTPSYNHPEQSYNFGLYLKVNDLHFQCHIMQILMTLTRITVSIFGKKFTTVHIKNTTCNGKMCDFIQPPCIDVKMK